MSKIELKKENCGICGKSFYFYELPIHIEKHEISTINYIKKYGDFKKLNKNKRDIQKIKCKECGNKYSSAGMHTHLTHTHNMEVEEYVEKHGEYRKKQKKRKRRKENSDYQCKICNEDLVSDRQLSFHVRKKHNISKKEYVLEYVFEGSHPTCKCGCEEKVKILDHEPYKRDFISGHNSKGENNPMFGKSHTRKTKEKMKIKKFDSLIERLENKSIKPLFKFEKYEGVEYKKPFKVYRFKCNECNEKFKSDLRRSRIPSCPKCTQNGISKQHLELRKFFNSLNINYNENCRKVLPDNKELDFYLPEYNLAVEFDGLYWHCQNSGNKNKSYHISKTKECEEKNIQLIHIFEDEWERKKSIVKSRLKYILNIHNGERIYARNCNIKKTKPKRKNKFLNNHHIQGEDRSSVKLGLFNNEKLVSIMTFSSPRAFQSGSYENNTWEISRFCSHKNKIVVGGFGKLFKHFTRNYKVSKIITYADRRYTFKPSNVYSKYGFKLKSSGTPNYWYTLNYNERKHRFNFTKSCLIEKYDADPEKTEWENMKEMGYDRIWDCGHLKYVWKRN